MVVKMALLEKNVRTRWLIPKHAAKAHWALQGHRKALSSNCTGKARNFILESDICRVPSFAVHPLLLPKVYGNREVHTLFEPTMVE